MEMNSYFCELQLQVVAKYGMGGRVQVGSEQGLHSLIPSLHSAVPYSLIPNLHSAVLYSLIPNLHSAVLYSLIPNLHSAKR